MSTRTDRLWTVNDLATYLGKSHRTIYRMHATGRGPTALLLGGHLRYRPDDVEAWLQPITDTTSTTHQAWETGRADDQFWRAS